MHFAAVLSLLDERQVIYEGQNGSINQINMDDSATIRLEYAYNFWRDAEFFISLGGGSASGTAQTYHGNPNPPNDIDFDQSHFKLGLSWTY